MRFSEKLARRIEAAGSQLCVGLDPRPDLIPGDLREFLLRTVRESAESAACFKPNMAYFEAMGSRGIGLLEDVLAAIPTDIPVLLDAKRSDIGETQKYYARAVFETWNCAAVTLNPFLGFDSLEPFLDYPGRGVYLLAVTSNPGAADLELRTLADGRPVWQLVQDLARRATGRPTDVGYVLGLTNAAPDLLAAVDDVPLLIPGLGAQGGDLRQLRGSARTAPILINVSRAILYPSEGTPGAAARFWRDRIREAAAEVE